MAPRYDLSHAQAPLDEASVEAIAVAITPFAAERTHMDSAFSRYPGRFSVDDFFSPYLPSAQNLRNCLRGVNQEVLLRPFLSRVIEDQWRNDGLKEAVLRKMPDLVLAPIGLEAALQTVADGFHRLLGLIAVNPQPGAVGARPGDDKAFRMVSENRKALLQLRETLGHLRALKGLHDALHVLQIGSADWLEPAPEDEEEEPDLLPPIAALAKLVQDAEAIVADKIPALDEAHATLGRQAMQTLAVVGSELRAADSDARSAGLERLRSALMSLPKDIDAAIFDLSRDLPVRCISHAFGGLNDSAQPDYAGFDRVQAAMAQLGEALRGRVREHAMWQAIDVSLYALENTLCSRDPGFLELFVRRWQEIRRFIRYLSDRSFGDNPPDSLVGMALVAYDLALQTQTGGRADLSPDEAFDEIFKTFSAFKAFPRERFLAVDKALKEELALLGALQKDLDELLDGRVLATGHLLLDP
jgi:hypothetical protein